MTNIKEDVEQGRHRIKHAKEVSRGTPDTLTDEDLANPDMCRRRFAKIAADNERHKEVIASLMAELRHCKKRLAALTPTAEVRTAMSVRTARMRPVLASVNGRTLVIVAPADGFQDPDRSYGRIVGQYGGEAVP